ncbi:hypothetical protein ABZ787_12780, partial [Micrococcus luteus]
YTIVHALEGYDEVSLTCDVKTFSNKGEQILTLNDMGFEKVNVNAIKGGDAVASSAKIFMDVLNGEATDVQTNVVLCNAALAIRTIKPEMSFADCFYEAEESLMNKKALHSFKQLLAC